MMEHQSIFIVAYFIIGLSLAIFAEPIARKDYKYDLRWKILLILGIQFRIWFFRIAGVLMMCMAVFVLMQSRALQFS